MSNLAALLSVSKPSTEGIHHIGGGPQEEPSNIFVDGLASFEDVLSAETAAVADLASTPETQKYESLLLSDADTLVFKADLPDENGMEELLLSAAPPKERPSGIVVHGEETTPELPFLRGEKLNDPAFQSKRSNINQTMIAVQTSEDRIVKTVVQDTVEAAKALVKPDEGQRPGSTVWPVSTGAVTNQHSTSTQTAVLVTSKIDVVPFEQAIPSLDHRQPNSTARVDVPANVAQHSSAKTVSTPQFASSNTVSVKQSNLEQQIRATSPTNMTDEKPVFPIVTDDLAQTQLASKADTPFARSEPQTQIVRHATQQVAYAISQTANGSTEIQLSPEELGRVRITVQTIEGTLNVSVIAERSEVGDMMRRQSDSLAAQLKDAGFETINLSFENDSEGRATDTSQDLGDLSSASDDIAEEEPLALSLMPTSTEALDIRL